MYWESRELLNRARHPECYSSACSIAEIMLMKSGVGVTQVRLGPLIAALPIERNLLPAPTNEVVGVAEEQVPCLPGFVQMGDVARE
jgi:hypothetical protein